MPMPYTQCTWAIMNMNIAANCKLCMSSPARSSSVDRQKWLLFLFFFLSVDAAQNINNNRTARIPKQPTAERQFLLVGCWLCVPDRSALSTDVQCYRYANLIFFSNTFYCCSFSTRMHVYYLDSVINHTRCIFLFSNVLASASKWELREKSSLSVPVGTLGCSTHQPTEWLIDITLQHSTQKCQYQPAVVAACVESRLEWPDYAMFVESIRIPASAPSIDSEKQTRSAILRKKKTKSKSHCDCSHSSYSFFFFMNLCIF